MVVFGISNVYTSCASTYIESPFTFTSVVLYPRAGFTTKLTLLPSCAESGPVIVPA